MISHAYIEYSQTLQIIGTEHKIINKLKSGNFKIFLLKREQDKEIPSKLLHQELDINIVTLRSDQILETIQKIELDQQKKTGYAWKDLALYFVGLGTIVPEKISIIFHESKIFSCEKRILESNAAQYCNGKKQKNNSFRNRKVDNKKNKKSGEDCNKIPASNGKKQSLHGLMEAGDLGFELEMGDQLENPFSAQVNVAQPEVNSDLLEDLSANVFSDEPQTENATGIVNDANQASPQPEETVSYDPDTSAPSSEADDDAKKANTGEKASYRLRDQEIVDLLKAQRQEKIDKSKTQRKSFAKIGSHANDLHPKTREELEREIFDTYSVSDQPVEESVSKMEDAKASLVCQYFERIKKHINKKISGFSGVKLDDDFYNQIIILFLKCEKQKDLVCSFQSIVPGFILTMEEGTFLSLKKEIMYYYEICDSLYNLDLFAD